MKRIIKYIFILLIIGTISIFIFNYKNNFKEESSKLNSLINIDELSKEFIDKYNKEMDSLNDEELDNTLIVISESGIDNSYNASKVIEAPNNQYYLVYKNSEDKNKALNELNKSDAIYSVEENIKYDAFYNSWGITSTGLDRAINSVQAFSGRKSVTVAIIDTGCNTSLFASKYPNKTISYQNFYDGNPMYDDEGHGTHIAGTIAEGTPSNVKILVLKVSNDRSMYMSKIVQALNYVINNDAANVVNMSFGAESNSTTLEQTILSAKNQNIITVAAAGNDGDTRLNYPAALSTTIGVGAVNKSNQRASFSNYNSSVTFSAPGEYINSINGLKSGTSMAAPHVACAVAILKSYYSDYSLEEVISSLRFASTDLGTAGYDTQYGYGVINFGGLSFCNGNCTQRVIFEEEDDDNIDEGNVTSISVTPSFTTYNYGSITNLMGSSVRISLKNGGYATQTINNIPGATITGYDPYKSGAQSVTFKAYGKTSTVTLTNSATFITKYGYGYEVLDSTLKTIELNTTHIKDETGITKLYLPTKINGYTVTNIGNSLFMDSRIDYAYLPSNITSIGSYAFANAKLTKVNVKASSISIGNYTFKNNSSLTLFDGKISLIGAGSFYGCSSINNISLANSITQISMETFFGCTSLNSINLPSDLLSIGNKAFMNTGITSITIPNGVTKIDEQAFYGSNISSVILPRSVTNMAVNMFNSNTSIWVYYESTPYNFCKNNSLKYRLLDPSSYQVTLNKTTYTAGDTVNKSDLTIVAKYQDTNPRNENVTNYTIKYIDDKNGFRVGHTYFTINFTNTLGIPCTHNINVTVNGKTPTYTVPTGLKGNVGNKLSSITLPAGFSWMSPNIVMDSAGTKTYKIKYTPNDITMYSTVENINVSVTVSKTVITPTFTFQDLIYSGNTTWSNSLVSISNLNSSYYTITSFKTNTANAGNATATITVSLTSSASSNYSFTGGETSASFNASVTIKPKSIAKPTPVNKTYYYTGSTQTFEINGFNSSIMNISNNTRTSAGRQFVKVSLKSSNYCWNDNTTDPLEFSFIIREAGAIYAGFDYEGVYDGSYHTIDLDIDSGVTIKYSIDTKLYNLNTSPAIKEIGEYTIYYKITSGNKTYEDSNKISIYGIRSVDSSLKTVDNKLILYDYDTTTSLLSLFNIYATSKEVKVYDSNGNPTSNTKFRTGDKLYVILNGRYIANKYDVVVLGDINKDGNVNSGDLLKIRQHMLRTNSLSGIDFTAANLNFDGYVNSGDLLKIRQHMLGTNPIRR